MAITEKEIEKIQNIIKEDQKREIQLKTKLESDFSYVEKEYGLKTLGEIEDKLDAEEEELKKLDKQIEEKGEALKAAYPWDL